MGKFGGVAESKYVVPLPDLDQFRWYISFNHVKDFVIAQRTLLNLAYFSTRWRGYVDTTDEEVRFRYFIGYFLCGEQGQRLIIGEAVSLSVILVKIHTHNMSVATSFEVSIAREHCVVHCIVLFDTLDRPSSHLQCQCSGERV